MHDIHHAMIVVALVSAVLLVAQSSERLFAIIALLAVAIEAALAFRLMTLSVAKLRVDVILPAVIAVAGGIAWWRTEGKSQVTAATLVTVIGLLQLVMALHLVSG